MVMDPMNAWVITRDGQPVHLRMDKGMAEACANIERDVRGETYGAVIKVVPVLVTEIENVK